MALAEYELTGDVDAFVAHLDQAIVGGSVTAQLETHSDRRIGDARMVVQVYERYSAAGGNRLTLTVAVLAVGERMEVAAMTSGGSQAMFWKVNTFGEEAFLRKADDAVRDFGG